jgi:Fe-S cluster biogenesis protein NfuA
VLWKPLQGKGFTPATSARSAALALRYAWDLSGSILFIMGALRGTTQDKLGIEARISAILVEVQPLLRIDHCTLRLAEYASGVAVVAITGGCPDCEVSPATFSAAIQAHIRMRIPEVREVRIA